MTSLLEFSTCEFASSPSDDVGLALDLSPRALVSAAYRCIPANLFFPGITAAAALARSAVQHVVHLPQQLNSLPDWLPRHFLQPRSQPAIAQAQQPDCVHLSDSAPWLACVLSQGSYVQALDRSGMVAGQGLFPADHLFCALMRTHQVHDVRVLVPVNHPPAAPTQQPGPDAPAAAPGHAPDFTVLVAYQLGQDVCGHQGIVHGGLTAAMLDESFGYLLYLARRSGQVSFPKAVFTASLEVQYKQPLPSRAPLCITARVSKVEGRKIWVDAELANQPPAALMGPSSEPTHPRVVFATASALFIIPRA